MIRGARSAIASLTALATIAGVAALGVALAKPANVSTSRTFAGYEVTEPKTDIKTATVTFVVPTITCHKNYSGVGPSLVIDSTVVNNRYSYSGGGIAVVCEHNQPAYVALPIVDGLNYNDTNVPIAAGSTITLTVTYGQKTMVTLVDDTTHQTDTHTGKKSLGETAFFGDSGVAVNRHGLGLDSFTPTSFSAAKINGKEIGSEGAEPNDWVDSSGVTLISASKLSHGDAFTTTFKQSS